MSNISTNISMDSVIDYKISFSRFRQHLADVTFTFTANIDQPIVWLPSWLAGSYLMREFARHITALSYQIEDSDNKLLANKLSKNEWQLTEAKSGDTLKLTYEVYCYDLSVRTAYVDNQRIFGNFSSLALAVEGQESSSISASLTVPNTFYADKELVKIAIGLPVSESTTNDAHMFYIQAKSYDEFIDHPFEIAEQSEFSFTTQDSASNDIKHRFFISGRHTFNRERLQKDVQKICQTYNTWLGDTPFDDYTFMTFASGNDYGGLEHINSTALVIPRDDLPMDKEKNEPSESYQRYLGLCSHEYFHAWWVKTVRPDVMMNVDLRKEAYTPLLWVFEGFTSYIDDFMLQASGVVSQQSYLKLLTAQINRYYQTPGRELQSVAESSFDAWIKLYRADENTGNAGISYYNKGCLVALCLDLIMLAETNGQYRLFDIVRRFYEKAKENEHNGGERLIGMTNENLREVICEFIDLNVWQNFYEKYVVGVEDLPIKGLLIKNGIKVITEKLLDNIQPWGMTVTESLNGLTINKINRDSVASESGLSAKDVIVAIDGIKATKKQLAKVAKHQENSGQLIKCHAFRRDELMEFVVPAKTFSETPACASLNKVLLGLNAEKAAEYKIWLGALDLSRSSQHLE